MAFIREITDPMLCHLRELSQRPSWWRDILEQPDELFIGIRHKYINVYNNGRNVLLCKFPNGRFRLGTHHKYLGMSKPGSRSNIYLEGDSRLTIKGTEDGAFSVAKILNKVMTYPKASHENEKLHLHSVLKRNLHVIDVEIVFARLPKEVPDPQKEEPRTDRLDFVSVETEHRRYPTLVFYEAKEANSPELRAEGNREPKIITEQLERYRRQLRTRSPEIAHTYRKLLAQTAEIERMRTAQRTARIDLLDLAVKAAKLKIDPVPRLLIFEGEGNRGGNWEQHREKLKRLYREKFELSDGIVISRDRDGIDLPS